MNNARILNEQGEEIDEHSAYCPNCGSTDIVKNGPLTSPDFDEKGWYVVQNFKCNEPKCKHTWINKIMIAEGGQRFQNW